jgi:hypothetical protein
VEVGVTPSQQLVKLVNDQLTAALGGAAAPLARAERGPTVILLAGLQGAGKTTAAAKLAALLRRQGRTPMLVATDTFRPAAIEQLVKMGALVGVPVFEQGTRPKPADIARDGVAAAVAAKCDTVIIDTAGRIAVRTRARAGLNHGLSCGMTHVCESNAHLTFTKQIDEALMAELRAVKAATSPHEVLLVVDAMSGQDAGAAAKAFHDKLGLTGAVLTKMDGDARGGAALSVRAACGCVAPGADACAVRSVSDCDACACTCRVAAGSPSSSAASARRWRTWSPSTQARTKTHSLRCPSLLCPSSLNPAADVHDASAAQTAPPAASWAWATLSPWWSAPRR